MSNSQILHELRSKAHDKHIILKKKKFASSIHNKQHRVNSFVLVLVFHHTDTSLYLLSLALALSIHNKLLKHPDHIQAACIDLDFTSRFID
jgi:hypothetical protein